MKKVLSIIMALLVIPVGSAYALRAKAWAPYKGKSKVTKNSIINYFTFDQTAIDHYHSPLYKFVHTYEQETHTSKGWAKLDKYGYWCSNMPNAFLDTQRFDIMSSVDNYAVGTVRADLLKKDVQYFTALSLLNAKNSNAKIWIKPQWGMVNNPFPFAPNAWKCLAPIDTVCVSSYYGPVSNYISWEYR